MKKVLLVALVILSIGYGSCKKNDFGPGEIFGKWKLTEFWADPGFGGEPNYMKASGKPQYIMFNKLGQVAGDAIPGLLSFKVLDSVTMEVLFKKDRQRGSFRYELSGDSLTLYGGCIEGCSYRFIRN